jgi:LPXTG-site transpeptidase (sortase) family protein
MLQIATQRKSRARIVVTVVAVMILLAGMYILVTALAPSTSLPLLTGKSPQETVQRLSKPPGTYGDRLYIPEINVDVAIVTGSNSTALERGAWHQVPQNGDPVKGGNFVLSAHRFVMNFTPQGTAIQSPFYNIGKLVVGDRLFVDFQGQRYQYQIAKTYKVSPSAVEIEAPTKTPRLTLYSCTLNGSADGRDVIEATPTLQS